MPKRLLNGKESSYLTLLVEDNDEDYYTTKRFISSFFQIEIELERATTLAEAQKKCKENQYNLYLVDYSLPDGDGLTFVKNMREEELFAPIIILTGQGSRDVDLQAMNIGASDYLIKSELSPELLERAIRYAITRAIDKRELYQYQTLLEQMVQKRTRELENSQESLRRSERLASIGALAAGIAHEINNPVGAILLATQNAQEQIEELETPQSLRDLFNKVAQKIIRNATRCSTVVQGVLKFSKEQSSSKWPHHLQTIIDGAVSLIRESKDCSSLSLLVEVAPDIPEIVCNPFEIEQVIVNILANALEAGYGNATIRIHCYVENTSVILRISDDGPGMSEQTRQRAFDPFFSTKRERGGTGLGLSVAYGIVNDHNGSIHIESRLGSGSAFIIKLPLARKNSQEKRSGQSLT